MAGYRYDLLESVSKAYSEMSNRYVNFLFSANLGRDGVGLEIF